MLFIQIKIIVQPFITTPVIIYYIIHGDADNVPFFFFNYIIRIVQSPLPLTS